VEKPKVRKHVKAEDVAMTQALKALSGAFVETLKFRLHVCLTIVKHPTVSPPDELPDCYLSHIVINFVVVK